VSVGTCGAEVNGSVDVVADMTDTFYTDATLNPFQRDDGGMLGLFSPRLSHVRQHTDRHPCPRRARHSESGDRGRRNASLVRPAADAVAVSESRTVATAPGLHQTRGTVKFDDEAEFMTYIEVDRGAGFGAPYGAAAIWTRALSLR